MICDNLNKEEILEAYLVFSSLHGYGYDPEHVRQKVIDYCEHNVPDATIDEAILAYLDDAMLAPPDVVLERWGSSRLYVLAGLANDYRHRVCESWFNNGCSLPSDNAPELAHFWTKVQLDAAQDPLPIGSRVRFERHTQGEGLLAVHRHVGAVGSMPQEFSREMERELWSSRQFLGLVDRVDSSTSGWEQPLCQRLLVVTGKTDVSSEALVDYAQNAFWAKRAKC